jgi:hypothetical protein
VRCETRCYQNFQLNEAGRGEGRPK